MKYITLLLLATTTAFAGPPLICHPVQIGVAKSLPWKSFESWNGTDPAYNLASLSSDTLAILSPSAPINLRMETLRRAAIYTAKNQTLAAQMTAQLLARVADAEASGNATPALWFDAGFFAETLRQASFIYRFDMLTPAEKAQWQLRGETTPLDGKPWIEKAIRLGGKGMETVLIKVEEYRQADLKRTQKLVSAK